MTFQFYFSLLFSVLDFSECVLQAETGLFGGKDGRSITAICAATVALIRTGTEIIPVGLIGQEASPRETNFHLTVLQTVMELLSFLTQTQQVQGHWVCTHSLEISPVPSFLLASSCPPQPGCNTSTAQCP